MPSVKLLVIKVVLVGILAGWALWTYNAIGKIALLESTIETRDATINGLREELTNKRERDKKIDQGFDQLEEDQMELLCEARGYSTQAIQLQAPVAAPKPQIVEVTKYIDRVTKCPTTDPEKGEQAKGDGTVMRPTNEVVTAKVLNNSWKAYCLAVNDEGDQCTAFRSSQ